jgi:hypothetical protein
MAAESAVFLAWLTSKLRSFLVLSFDPKVSSSLADEFTSVSGVSCLLLVLTGVQLQGRISVSHYLQAVRLRLGEAGLAKRP